MTIDPIDLRTFPPVEPLSRLPENWRQTLLSKYVECPRSAYLYLKYNGGALTHPLAGGTLLHRALEQYIKTLLANNEPYGNPELAKEILNEQLAASTDLTVSPARFDSMRAMMFHAAEGFVIRPERVVCIETAVSMEIAGHRVTGQIDFAEASEFGVIIKDFKSAFYSAAKPREEFDEDDEEYVPTKEDWPGTFQLVLYAAALATGSIEGAPEGFNFGEYPEFTLQQIHPRQYWKNEEVMAYRQATITREALLDWRDYLTSMVKQMEAAFGSWEFPAVIGSHCDFCPASAECPIPAPLRDFRGEIRTAADAERAAIRKERHDAASKSLWKALKGYFKDHQEPLRFGRDLELYWKKVEQERMVKKIDVLGAKYEGKIALRMLMERSNEGAPVHFPEWKELYVPSVSTRLTRRKLTPAELNNQKGKK